MNVEKPSAHASSCPHSSMGPCGPCQSKQGPRSRAALGAEAVAQRPGTWGAASAAQQGALPGSRLRARAGGDLGVSVSVPRWEVLSLVAQISHKNDDTKRWKLGEGIKSKCQKQTNKSPRGRNKELRRAHHRRSAAEEVSHELEDTSIETSRTEMQRGREKRQIRRAKNRGAIAKGVASMLWRHPQKNDWKGCYLRIF